MARPPILRLAATLAFGTLPLVGCGDPETDASFASLEGETLLARNNCTACHAAGAATVERIRPMAGPVLLGHGGVGSRKTEAGIARALREPKPGMPDLLGRVPVDQRKQAFDDLVTYLASQGGPLAEERIELQADEAVRGKTLYTTIGCAACHGADSASLGLVTEGQEEAMTLTSLAKHLRVPH
jgi:cytochrome c1